MGNEDHNKAQFVGENYYCNGTDTQSLAFFQVSFPLASFHQLVF